MLIHVYIDQHQVIQVVNEVENLQARISYDRVKQITLVVRLVAFQSE